MTDSEPIIPEELLFEEAVIAFTRKTQVMLCGEIQTRIPELHKLNRFHNIDSINGLLGNTSCYIKQCRNASAYVIIDESERKLKRDQILAAAIPVNFPLEPDREVYFRTRRLILELISKNVPIFFISEAGCHLHYIFINEDQPSKIGFQCPHTRVNTFECILKNKGFCEHLKTNGDYSTSIKELLFDIQEAAKQSCLPVFELSAFIDFCIAEHHYTDRMIGKNEEELENKRFSSSFHSFFKQSKP